MKFIGKFMSPSRKEAAQMNKTKRGALARLLNYIVDRHRWGFIFVVVCVLVNVICGMIGSLFVKILI